MKASLDAINAAKRHIVVLDAAPDRKAGVDKKTVVVNPASVTSVTAAPKKPVALASATVYAKMPAPKMPAPIAAAAAEVESVSKRPKKTHKKLSKLIRGRTVYDFSM